MSTGEIIAIVLGAISVAVLLLAFFLIRRLYMKKMEEASRVLGIGCGVAAELERQGQLPGGGRWAIPLPSVPKPWKASSRVRPKQASSTQIPSPSRGKVRACPEPNRRDGGYHSPLNSTVYF